MEDKIIVPCPSACVNVRSCFALAHIRGSMRFDSAMAKGMSPAQIPPSRASPAKLHSTPFGAWGHRRSDCTARAPTNK